MNTEKFLITAKQLADEMNEKEILIFHQREEIKKIENELELIRQQQRDLLKRFEELDPDAAYPFQIHVSSLRPTFYCVKDKKFFQIRLGRDEYSGNILFEQLDIVGLPVENDYQVDISVIESLKPTGVKLNENHKKTLKELADNEGINIDERVFPYIAMMLDAWDKKRHLLCFSEVEGK